MRLYVDSELRPKAEIVALSATFHSERGNYDEMPRFPHPETQCDAGLAASLFTDELELGSICAPGLFWMLMK